MSDFKCRIQGEVRGSESGVTDADLSQINRFTLKPLTADDVAVFGMDLCNDQIDRHHSRFPHEELTRINEMIVGKPLMQLHQTSERQPSGTFFQSHIYKQSGRRAAVDGAAWSVRPDSYILREGNEELIRNIEGGVYRGTSIGFSFEKPECSICETDLRECSHWPGEEYDGHRCHYVMHDVNDVYEGSIVPLGSQGTEFISARSARPEDLPIYNALGSDWAGCNPALAAARTLKPVYTIRDPRQEILDGIALEQKEVTKISTRLYHTEPTQ